MILIYRDQALVSSDTIEDIEIYLKRPMFHNIDIGDIGNSLYIDNRDIFSAGYSNRYRLNIINTNMYITDIEYEILSVIYSNNDEINDAYSLYQYIYKHPLLRMDSLDDYIKYREDLDKLCELDYTYKQRYGRELIDNKFNIRRD